MKPANPTISRATILAATLLPAADWLDRNQQEALSGQLREIIRSHA